MILNCVNDNVEFEAKRVSAKFCSPQCRVEYSRKNKEDAVVSAPDSTEKKSLKTIQQERKNPATGEVIPQEVLDESRKRREKFNAYLVEQGLPLITSGPEQVYFVSSGIEEIDSLTRGHDVLGVGGFPRKKITEIFGTAGSSKSSLVKSIISDVKIRVLYIDVEGGLTSPPENVDIVRVSLVEEVEAILIKALEDQTHDIILVDSVAPLVTKKRFEGDLDGMGAKAKAMSNMVNSVVARLRPSVDGAPEDVPGTAVVFINQLRDTMQSFGKREFTPGGRSIEFAASFRLEFRSAKGDVIIRKKNGVSAVVGQWVRVKVIKTRYGIKDEEVRFELSYDKLKKFDDYYQERLKEILG